MARLPNQQISQPAQHTDKTHAHGNKNRRIRKNHPTTQVQWWSVSSSWWWWWRTTTKKMTRAFALFYTLSSLLSLFLRGIHRQTTSCRVPVPVMRLITIVVVVVGFPIRFCHFPQMLGWWGTTLGYPQAAFSSSPFPNL